MVGPYNAMLTWYNNLLQLDPFNPVRCLDIQLFSIGTSETDVTSIIKTNWRQESLKNY